MPWGELKEKLAREILIDLYEHGMIKTFYRDRPQGWVLFSGQYSPLYVQLRALVSYPDTFRKVSQAMAQMAKEEVPEITKIIGIAMAGIPVASGMALAGGIPAAYTRKIENAKSFSSMQELINKYGEHSLMEGELESGERLALVDDLVTTFSSKELAFAQVNHEIQKRGLSNVECRKVLVVLDREQGGRQAALEKGIDLVSLIPFKTGGLPLLKGVMHPKEWQTIAQYLEDPKAFQDDRVQKEIEKFSRAA
ncbi:MAG: orotate phosphoribosyltransferase [Desulfomonilaceae bacterium]